MAEGNEQKRIPKVAEDLQSAENHTFQKKSKDPIRLQEHINILQKATKKIATLAFDDESAKQRDQFCKCVKELIKGYKKKSSEVDGLKNVIQGMKKRNKEKDKEKDKETKQLKQVINAQHEQLDSVCESCKTKRVTTAISSLLFQDSGGQSSVERETDEIDGQAVENQEMERNDSNPVTDEEVEVQLQAAKKEDKKICPYAGCVSDAFECLFQKLNINFCTSKFLQMYGRYTFWHDFPSCTEMLNDFERLVFIERVHICANEQGNHEEKLNEIAQKLIGSKQKAGLLWYSKDDTKHCVTVYVASNGTQMEIEDKNMNQNYITDLPSVREFILFVLKCDSEGKPLIETQWKDYCHTDLCENESQQLSEASKYLE